jgi:hypothetical protein
MAIRPIKGRPGKFLDTGTGKVLDISDYREDDKFDTVIIGDGAGGGATLTAGEQFIFFRDVAQKRLIDTNFTQQSRLSAGEELIIDRVGMTVRDATGNLLPTPSDVKKLVSDAFLRIEVNRILLIEGPAVKFPSGYGLYGNTVENGQGIVSVGVPSTAAALKLLKTQLITSEHEMQGFLTFYDRNWTGADLNAADRMPTFSQPLMCTTWLHGLIKQAVSK